jgi:hypothetical protein
MLYKSRYWARYFWNDKIIKRIYRFASKGATTACVIPEESPGAGIILRKFNHCTKAQKNIKICEYKVVLEKVWLPNSEHQTVSYFPI